MTEQAWETRAGLFTLTCNQGPEFICSLSDDLLNDCYRPGIGMQCSTKMGMVPLGAYDLWGNKYTFACVII